MSDDVPAFYGSHILGTSSLRIFDASMDDSYDKEVPPSLLPSVWTTEAIQGHIKTLLNLLPRKLDCIVFVNDGLFKIEQTQAAVSAVTKGTIVRVIPALMARFLYVTHNIQPPLNDDQHILMLTKLSDITDFHILQRKNGTYIFIHEFLGWPANVPIVFDKYAAKYVAGDAGKAVIIYDEMNEKVKDECIEKCPSIDIIQTVCPKWDEMLLSGGLNKASTLISEAYKTAMDVKDFTTGCQLNVGSGNEMEKSTLIAVGATIPLKFVKELESDKHHLPIKVRSNCTTILKGIAHKRLMNPYYTKKLDKGKYLLCIVIDENGVEEVTCKKIVGGRSEDIKPSQEDNEKSMLQSEQSVNASLQMGSQNIDIDSSQASDIQEAALNVAPVIEYTRSPPHDSSPFQSSNAEENNEQSRLLPPPHPQHLHRRRSRSPQENSASRHERQHQQENHHHRERSPQSRRRNSRSHSPESHRSRSPLRRSGGLENHRKSSADNSTTVPPEVAEQKSLILPNPAADFMICLNERHCCICLPAEGNTTTRITNVNGNKWIPMYVSFNKVPPVIGEVAKADLLIEPEAVLYDICKFIGTPYKDIQINPEWAFGVAYTGKKEQKTVLEVQTWKGPHAVYPVNVLALLFVGLHKEAVRVAGKELKRVFVKKTRPVGKEESDAIKEAIRIARLECAGIETMQNITVNE
uniref:Uncharacterized protein n=1 Tax=Panagrolaimus sp. PS1159 TaxID=55785 RepID=A0AC35GEF3_9BILA